MGKMPWRAEETHGSGHARTGGTEAAAGGFDPEQWRGGREEGGTEARPDVKRVGPGGQRGLLAWTPAPVGASGSVDRTSLRGNAGRGAPAEAGEVLGRAG